MGGIDGMQAKRATKRAVAALSMVLFTAAPASAAWQQFRMKNGVGLFAIDVTTRAAIGIICDAAQLKAVATPVPAGAPARVKVSYEIDGREFSEDWAIEDKRLVAKGADAMGFVARLRAMKGAMWFQVGDGPRSLAMATGLLEKLDPILAECGAGS